MLSAAASILYPSMASATPAASPAPAAAPIPSPAPQVATAPAQALQSPPAASEPASAYTAEALAAAIPAEVKAARDADTTRRLYSNMSDLAKVLGPEHFPTLPPDAAKALAGELHQVARDLGASATDIAMLRGELQRASQRPATPESRAADRDATIAAVNARYGADAASLVKQASAFVARDPRLSKLLARAGDSPQLTLRIIELARAARR